MSGYPDAPGHRGIDTSIAAAAALAPDLSRLQQLAATAIKAAGVNGLTSDEVAERIGVLRWTIRARTAELRSKGVIVDSGRRRENVTGRQAIVWVAAAFAAANNAGAG